MGPQELGARSSFELGSRYKRHIHAKKTPPAVPSVGRLPPICETVLLITPHVREQARARFRCACERPRAQSAIPRLITSAPRRRGASGGPRAQAQEPWPPARAARAARPRRSTTTASRTRRPEFEEGVPRPESGVPRCCGAFTPSTRVVSRNDGAWVVLFRFFGASRDREMLPQVRIRRRRGGGADRRVRRRAPEEEKEFIEEARAQEGPHGVHHRGAREGTIKRPTENTITSTGAFNGESSPSRSARCVRFSARRRTAGSRAT